MVAKLIFLLSLFIVLVLGRSEDLDRSNIVIPNSLHATKWQRESLRRARIRLAELLDQLSSFEDNIKCLRDKQSKIAELSRKLDRARSCRQRGVDHRKYVTLIKLCRGRLGIQADLIEAIRLCKKRDTEAARNRCSTGKVKPLRGLLRTAIIACRKIGLRDRDTSPGEDCPGVPALKRELVRVSAIRCGGKKSRKSIKREIEMVKDEITRLRGLLRPRPSNSAPAP